jgi:hypothetical protein
MEEVTKEEAIGIRALEIQDSPFTFILNRKS